MMLLRRLRRCCRGAAVIEFALLVPVFLAFLFGIIEGSRAIWTKHTMDEVAFATSRCMAVNADCDTLDAQKQFAVDRATAYGVPVTLDDVTPDPDSECGEFPSATSVSIDYDFFSVVANLNFDMHAESCFPRLS